MKKGALVKIIQGYFSSDDICIVITDSKYVTKSNYYFDKESKSIKGDSKIVTECFVYNSKRNKILKVYSKDLEYV